MQTSNSKTPVGTGASEHSGIVFHGPETPSLVNWNIAQLLDRQKEAHGDSCAVLVAWQGQKWTYSQLHAASRLLAYALLQRGVRPGDRVVVLASNSIEYVQLFFAVTAIGAIVVIANATFTAPEIMASIALCDPRAVVVSRRVGFRNNHGLLQSLAALDSGASWQLVYIGDKTTEYGSALSFSQLIPESSVEETDRDSLDRFWGQFASNEVLCFQFTSGTTGPRKASMLSHRNLVNNARLVANRLRLSPDDTLCSPPPLSHCFGLVCGLLAGVTAGCTVSLPSAIFDPGLVLKSWAEERCTIVNAVPAMSQSLLDTHANSPAPSSAKYSLRGGIIAGGSLSGTQLQQLHERFGLDGLIYPLGMTELSAVSFSTTLDHSLRADWSSVGTVMPHTSAKVVDPEGKTLPPGQAGELCVSGYLVHQGYYRAPEKSSEILSVDEGENRAWLHTGDLVSIGIDGRCTVMGRAKDLIKKGGENIIPTDIEQMLLDHPDIANAAVVGIPDRKWGEGVVAVIQRSSHSSSSSLVGPKQLKAWLRRRNLAAHKMPDHFLVLGQDQNLPQEMPINGSGKILKNELKRDVQTFLRADVPKN